MEFLDAAKGFPLWCELPAVGLFGQPPKLDKQRVDTVTVNGEALADQLLRIQAVTQPMVLVMASLPLLMVVLVVVPEGDYCFPVLIAEGMSRTCYQLTTAREGTCPLIAITGEGRRAWCDSSGEDR